MSLSKNYDKIKRSITSSVKFVAVTKNRSVRSINQLGFIGITDIGENKVQEAKEKKAKVKADLKWHMIGHLQSNKVKDAVEVFDMIQSLDSLKLAKKIDSVCKSKGKIIAVLVEVNISKDPKKYGFGEEELLPFLKEVSKLKNIKVLGLMAMAPFIDSKLTKPYFGRMKLLFENIKKLKIPNIEMKYLSMGMSNDYNYAVEEGANMVRVGSALFK